MVGSVNDPAREPLFVRPPARLVAGPVHVWRFGVGDELSDAERAAAAKFLSVPARDAFVAGRSGIRRAAAISTGLDPGELVVSISASGKPFFENADLHFNVSHSGGVVVAAFSGSPVGIDIEVPGRCRDFSEIARRFFHPDEAERCSGEDEFLRLWTAKEAMLKLAGTGLSGGMADARPDVDGRGEVGGRGVWLERFRVGPCVGAVASFEPFEVKGWFQI
jgi:phosphopantetheinyl transferase